MELQQLQAMIALARAGRADGYRALLDAYGSRLYGYFLRATSNSHQAEDLLGELMVRLVKNLKKYDERGRFEPWLFRIAANMVRDRFRRLKRQSSVVSIHATDSIGVELVDRLAGAPAPVDADLLAVEQSTQLSAALEKLDESTREAILMRYFGHMSFKEIAAACDCPLGTALARVHRDRWVN